MTLLAVERIKLFSTRSPWWCAIISLALTIGFAALFASQLGDEMPVAMTQVGHTFGLMVMLVLAALSITTEYRFSTIRATFQAVPNRTAALLSKTVVVAAVALVIGELAAFGSWAVSALIAPGADLSISTADAWRNVAGVGPVFALGAVLAVAVGALLRQTAGAVTVLLLWSLLVENLIGLIPRIGEDVRKWMPFVAVDHFLSGSSDSIDMPYSPWFGLAYFALIAIGLWVVALIIIQRRDA